MLGSVTLDTCSFKENEAGGEGGAIYFAAGTAIFSDLTFLNNSPTDLAGESVENVVCSSGCGAGTYGSCSFAEEAESCGEAN